MRYIFILAAFFITSSAMAQGIWTQDPSNRKQRSLKVDSVMIAPRDTNQVNGMLYNGFPLGDGARIGYKNGIMYYHNGVKFIPFSTGGGDLSNYYTKLEADAAFIKDQFSISENKSFRIAGQGRIDNTLQVGTLTLPAAPLQVGTLPSYANLSAIFEGNIQTVPAILGTHAVTLSQLSDSINGLITFRTKLTPLVTELNLDIQPTDSLTQALGKLQAQINYWDGKSIDNQDTTDQLASARISGTYTSKANSNQFIADRPAQATADAVITFRNVGTTMGHLGLSSRLNNWMRVAALRSSVEVVPHLDSGRFVISAYRPAPSESYRQWLTVKNAKMLIGDLISSTYDTARVPVQVLSNLDTSMILNKRGVMQSLTITGGSPGVGKYLQSDATGNGTWTALSPILNQTTAQTADFNVTGTGRVGGVLSMGNTSRIVGTSTGGANVGYLAFYESNGTTRMGYIGDAGNAESDITAAAESGAFRVVTGGGERVKVLSTGETGFGTSSPTAKVDVNGATGYNQLRLRTKYTPTGTADANGNVGDLAWDDNNFYIKTSAGWKQIPLQAIP